MIQKKNITALILAGGKSSRMGSDKAMLELDGTTFLARIIEVVVPLVDEVMIIGNNAEYDKLQFKRHPDLIANSGPMGGLFTGLFYSESAFNLVLSCDVPMINSAVIQYLLEGSNAESDVNQLESEGESLPLVALYKKQCMHPCLEALKSGERRMRAFVAQLQTTTIKLEPEMEPLVRNINTMAQLKALKDELEH